MPKLSGTKRRGFLEGFFLQNVLISAKWPAGATILECFFLSFGRDTGLYRNPFAKTPFSWFVDLVSVLNLGTKKCPLGVCDEHGNGCYLQFCFVVKLDLPLHWQCNSNSSIPTITSAVANSRIYHVILMGLGQELDLHLPLQCNSEVVAQ